MPGHRYGADKKERCDVTEEKGFIGRLFDFSFSEFVTAKVIPLLFGIAVVFHAFAVLVMIVGRFRSGFWGGLLFLILSPLVYLLMVLMVRIWCELVIVVFKIAENTRVLAAAAKPAAAPEAETASDR